MLLRHGRSTGYSENTFSGWLDVRLSAAGEREAVRAGRLLRAHELSPDVVHTSVLARATATVDLLLPAAGSPPAPVRRDWRLNERHYGALQGRSRAEVRAEVGDELFTRWRRSYEHAPPPAPDGGGPPLLSAAPPPPATESLADVRRRVESYWQEAIAPDLAAGRCTLVVGHSNSLRALCMLLDELSPDEVARLDLPTGIPLRYDLDAHLRPLRRGGTYLGRQAAAEGVAEVRAQGRLPAPPPISPSPTEERA